MGYVDLHNLWVKAGGLIQGRASGRYIKNVGADFVGLLQISAYTNLSFQK